MIPNHYFLTNQKKYSPQFLYCNKAMIRKQLALNGYSFKDENQLLAWLQKNRWL
jgi:hypothetical protein